MAETGKRKSKWMAETGKRKSSWMAETGKRKSLFGHPYLMWQSTWLRWLSSFPSLAAAWADLAGCLTDGEGSQLPPEQHCLLEGHRLPEGPCLPQQPCLPEGHCLAICPRPADSVPRQCLAHCSSLRAAAFWPPHWLSSWAHCAHWSSFSCGNL